MGQDQQLCGWTDGRVVRQVCEPGCPWSRSMPGGGWKAPEQMGPVWRRLSLPVWNLWPPQLARSSSAAPWPHLSSVSKSTDINCPQRQSCDNCFQQGQQSQPGILGFSKWDILCRQIDRGPANTGSRISVALWSNLLISLRPYLLASNQVQLMCTAAGFLD